ncbi:MAG TPA: ABC transporter substrate-binding protein [Phototrophicaceae bacterium]|nr:ABC transporter substrate-binding protein [Phototrophicaceae bacterium]
MRSRNEIRIGVVATLIGPYEALGREGVAGVELAVAEFGGQIAGKPVKVIVKSSNAIADSAVDAVKNLLDREQVDFVVGPLSGNEGLAVRDYAKTRPRYAFLNGCSAAQDLTLRNAAPNFFNFSPNAVQNMAGLGSYAYETLGYRTIVTLGEDYSYPHGLVGGFMIEFCRAGGHVSERFWVRVGQRDFRDFFAAVPRDADAILVCLTGNDAVEFIRQYVDTGLNIPLIGGATTFEPVSLSALGAVAEAFVGAPSGGPVSEGNPDPRWQAFTRAYQPKSPNGAVSPSFPTYGYYLNAKAALFALEAINAEYENGQENFKAVLAEMAFDSPTGLIRLDHNRQVIANQFISVLDRGTDGALYNRLVQTIPDVDQTLGIPEETYLTLGTIDGSTPIERWVESLRLGD